MRNPSTVERGLFVVSLGSVLVGFIFTVAHWPANGLFASIGAGGTLWFYIRFHLISGFRWSDVPKHITLTAFLGANLLRTFEIKGAEILLLLVVLALMGWIAMSTLERLPAPPES